jgi:hypothetical protein
VVWETACSPTELGCLGISDLRNLGWTLRARWLWLQKKEPHRPWSALSIQVPIQVQKLCSMAIIFSDVGNSENTLFWTDRWLHNHCIKDLAPRLFAVIPQRKKIAYCAAGSNQPDLDLGHPRCYHSRGHCGVFSVLGPP